MLGRIELLELLRLRSRWSLGSRGCNPLWRAYRLRMSVREITPVSLPEIPAPGSVDAETTGWEGVKDGEAGVEPN